MQNITELMNTQADYERRLKEMRDIHNVEAYARKTAIAEGRKEGRAEERQKMIKSLLANGASFELLAKSFGMTVDEVKQIAAV